MELNKGLKLDFYPCTMKLPNVSPVQKKSNRSEKGNYRLVSILPNISKFFERCVIRYASMFSKNMSKYQYGFRKVHRAQHALIHLLEK